MWCWKSNAVNFCGVNLICLPASSSGQCNTETNKFAYYTSSTLSLFLSRHFYKEESIANFFGKSLFLCQKGITFMSSDAYLSESCICSFSNFYYGTLPRKSMSHSCMMNLSRLLIILNVTRDLISSECCQWRTVSCCCFLSENSRSKSQPGGNTACSFWTSLTVVWHQPPGRAEAGLQDTPRSVQASTLLRTAHSSTVISQCWCQLRTLGKQCDKKKKSIFPAVAAWSELSKIEANADQEKSALQNGTAECVMLSFKPTFIWASVIWYVFTCRNIWVTKFVCSSF